MSKFKSCFTPLQLFVSADTNNRELSFNFFLKLAYFIFYIFLICNAKLILLENFLNNPFNFTLNLLVIL